jgi:hypothetical protein
VAWSIWRSFLSQNITSRHRTLRRPLGPWLIIENWKWFFNPGDESWICLSHGLIASSSLYTTQTAATPTTLEESIQNLPSAAQWSVKNFKSSDNGELIAKAITEGTAIAVCDGSYKEGKGSSAWVLEGASPTGRIIGSNLPPGISSGQNSYRSELAGLYDILTMLSTLRPVHQLSSGKIAIACDNISALNNLLDTSRSQKISDAEHDLIYAMKNQLASIPISYQSHHVKGHQDEVRPKAALDRWSLLNIEMDNLAKSLVDGWVDSLGNQQIAGEPWVLWSNDVKLINDMGSKLYEILHSKAIEEYWIKKRKITEHGAYSIHWEAIEKAMKEVTLAKRTLITKHVTGMCGVSMKLWGERDTDACPRCGAPEDASHVWTCPQEQANDVWNLSLRKLNDLMIEVGTSPELHESIVYNLDTWRSPESTRQYSAGHNLTPLDLQREYGWQSFLEGFVTEDWANIQNSYYRTIQASRTGRRWLIELKKKLWATAWDQWEHRNAVLHKGENVVQHEEMELFNDNITRAYHEYKSILPPTDSYFLATL